MNHLACLLTALLLGVAAPAWADASRDDAAAIAQQASNGRVLAVERAERAGRQIWRVKVLTPNGEVRVILIDVVSARVL